MTDKSIASVVGIRKVLILDSKCFVGRCMLYEKAIVQTS